MKLGIIKEFQNSHKNYIDACKDMNIEYEVIDLSRNNWIDTLRKSDVDGLLIWPSCRTRVWKEMYDEKLYFVENELAIPIYPSYKELYLYENKKNMAYWLESNNIKHPKTWVFYNKKEACEFIEKCKYPLVFKTSSGSGASGVKLINNKKEASKVINKLFTKLKFWNLGYTRWVKSYKYKIKYPLMDDKQFNFIIFQECIDIKYEWRGIKIGESYFAHKKLANKDGFHSGSGNANYDSPPISVFNYIEEICSKGKFNSMNVDFFEDMKGDYYVNELQTLFGSKINRYQMLVDGEEGRYVQCENEWRFEKGIFNQNNSCNLRINNFLEILKNNKVDK